MHALDIGFLVAFHRKKAGLTQLELAKLSGVSRFVVQDIEAGSGRTTWKHLVSVLNSLNLELEPKGPLVDAWQALRKARE